MSKGRLIPLFFFLFVIFAMAQEENTNDKDLDSLQTSLKEDGIVIQDSLFKKRKPINPLAPSKAAFLSAVLPGLGQIYNRRYWKVPIVYAVIGTGIYSYVYNDDLYDRFRAAFKRRQAGFKDDEFWDLRTPDDGMFPATPDLDQEDLENQQDRFQRDRDLALLVTIAMYALNIVDANVDAHLKQFNVDEDLSFDIRPYLDVNPITNTPNYGVAFIIKF